MNIRRVIVAIWVAMTLSAVGCDGAPPSASGNVAKSAISVHGSVSNKVGPITKGKLDVLDAQGAVLQSQALDGSSEHYQLELPAGTRFPIVLAVTPEVLAGAKENAKDPAKAVLMEPPLDRVDISATSTMVVDWALARGGLTPKNVADAALAAAQHRLMGGGGDAGGGGHGGH